MILKVLDIFFGLYGIIVVILLSIYIRYWTSKVTAVTVGEYWSVNKYRHFGIYYSEYDIMYNVNGKGYSKNKFARFKIYGHQRKIGKKIRVRYNIKNPRRVYWYNMHAYVCVSVMCVLYTFCMCLIW